ncbi:MAG: CRTAC1 family protein, partial [Planctomycetota bacterium]
DGLPDLLVANDMQRSQLFLNRGSGQFKEASRGHGFTGDGEGKPTSAMGLAIADVDNDGDYDVLRTNFDMEPNSLHLNQRNGFFRERARQFGLAQPSEDRLGWGAAFFDAELDGDLDLVVANGHVYPQAEEIGMHPWAQVSQLFEAIPHDKLGVRWRDTTAKVGGDGFSAERSSRGLAVADADNDGDMDVLILDIDHAPRLLENKSPRRGHWIGVRTVGSISNRDGYGARIQVKTGETIRTAEVMPVQGLYSSHDPRVHFGLGPVDSAEWLEVRWPSGIVQRIESPELDEWHVVSEPNE